MKEKLRDVTFWLSVAGGIGLLLQAFGLKIDTPLFNEALTAVCGALVLMGALKGTVKKTSNENEDGAESNENGADNKNNKE
jgi:uncharacterized membrane protein